MLSIDIAYNWVGRDPNVSRRFDLCSGPSLSAEMLESICSANHEQSVSVISAVIGRANKLISII